MIANARGSNYINFDILNPKNIGTNTQKEIDKMIEDIKTSVDTVKKMSEISEEKEKIDINKAANDYVIVNPTSSNDPKTSAEYNRGFAMGVKSSFVVAGSIVAAGYLMKGAEGLYKKVRNKDNEEPKAIGNQVIVQQPTQQQIIQQRIPQQQPTQQQIIQQRILQQQPMQQQVMQLPKLSEQTPVVSQQVINNITQ